MRQRGPVFRQQLQGQRVTRTKASASAGHTRFVQARLILCPVFGQIQPRVHQAMALSGDIAQVDRHLTVVHFAQATTPLTGHPHRLPAGLGKCRGITHQHPIALSPVPVHLADQRRAQGRIVPLGPADEALQRQAGLAKTLRNRCDIFPFDVRQQATDRGFGMVIGYLTLEGFDKGRPKGVQTGDDLLEKLRCHLTFVQPLGFANGVSRVHGQLLL